MTKKEMDKMTKKELIKYIIFIEKVNKDYIKKLNKQITWLLEGKYNIKGGKND